MWTGVGIVSSIIICRFLKSCRHICLGSVVSFMPSMSLQSTVKQHYCCSKPGSLKLTFRRLKLVENCWMTANTNLRASRGSDGGSVWTWSISKGSPVSPRTCRPVRPTTFIPHVLVNLRRSEDTHKTAPPNSQAAIFFACPGHVRGLTLWKWVNRQNMCISTRQHQGISNKTVILSQNLLPFVRVNLFA